jgi:hypothetical protein
MAKSERCFRGANHYCHEVKTVTPRARDSNSTAVMLLFIIPQNVTTSPSVGNGIFRACSEDAIRIARKDH